MLSDAGRASIPGRRPTCPYAWPGSVHDPRPRRRITTTRTASAGRPAAHVAAAPRARAVLRADPVLRLRLHPLDDLSVLHPLADDADLRSRRLRFLLPPVRPAELVQGAGKSGDLRQPLYRHLHRPRPDAGHPDRPAHSRRGRAAADLSLSDGAVLHRHRHGVEMVPQSRPGPGQDHACLGLGELQIRLADQLRHGDLHHRHRRRLADLGLHHGDVPCRPARHRRARS